MRYLIVIRKTSTGYSADAPDVLGCVAAERTVEKTRKLMASALQMHLELMEESGERIPKPRKRMPAPAESDGEEEFYTWVEVKLSERVAV